MDVESRQPENKKINAKVQPGAKLVPKVSHRVQHID